ncbi:MAG: lipoate--protein ligase family protein [Chitinispirillaceae bacterium]|nr:lipoate--protein ligase family protein [Chitinispirillaceae bacterium]
MAADLYLMKRVAEEEVVYVRFYTWNPPTVSLGCMQKPETQISLTELNNYGISWIQRPTGGRAVLHKGDLTYSCIFSKKLSFLGNSVATTYKIIATSLMNGLKLCGIDAQLEQAISPLIKAKEIKIPCFLAPNRSEIMVDGKKLIGSAQYRNATSVLQHGSIPITDDYLLLPYLLPISKEEKIRQVALLKEKTICIKNINPSLEVDSLINSLKDGFTNTLKLSFTEKNWSDEELKEIGSREANYQ